MNAGKFEARKHAIRQTQDGWVVSFVVHPSDVSAELAVAPLGTRYMIAFAQIGDDEQPVETPAKPRDITKSEQGKARYAAANDMEKALVRAALLPKDTRFLAWLSGRYQIPSLDEQEAAECIRDLCCAGQSRKLIAEDSACYDAFVKMETEYLIDTGALAGPR